MSTQTENEWLSNTFIPKSIAPYDEANLCVTIDDVVSVSISNANKNDECIERGIVRFIGCIDGKSASTDSYYYGIELESTNGKNDGKYKKIDYFRCGNKKGIFVKRSKILCVLRPNGYAARVTVGDTVSIEGKYKCLGIIKYIGIPSFKRLQNRNWYGIELNRNIGKSDGIYNKMVLFSSKKDYGILITSKWIFPRAKDDEDDEYKNGETFTIANHGISVRHFRSSTGSWSLDKTRTRSKTVKKELKTKTKTFVSGRTRSKTVGNRRRNRKRMKKKQNDDDADDIKSASDAYDKVWIIRDYGYPISFLLSDKKANICILKEQIIATFGHCEVLQNEQIEIKNVDKMCLLVRIHFHCIESFEKAIDWKFWWKKTCVSMKKHPFRKWKECIVVEEIFPIYFQYKRSHKISADYTKRFLIQYLNNLEELLQNKSQIQFTNIDDDGDIKCIINFANVDARNKLFQQEYIQLTKHIKCKLIIDTQSIPIHH